MKRTILILLFLFSVGISAQVPLAIKVQIAQAEDARRYDAVLENLMKSPNAEVRVRAALAAGRIGNDAAIPALEKLLEEGLKSPQILAMTAFSIGEIESIKGAEIISDILKSESGYAQRNAQLLSRAVEAAGKIAAANPNEPKSKELGAAIVRVLNDEVSTRNPSTEVIRLGLTAVLRARPAGAEETVRQFLAFTDPNIVADALNTLARSRAKNANREARDLLATHVHAIVRANAARVLGAAEDKDAVDVLIKAATTDTDPRVRVAAIRALGALKDAKAADQLLARGHALLDAYKRNLKPNSKPVEQNEFLEISTALGQILAKTGNARAIALFREFAKVDQFRTAEPYVARVRLGGIRPGAGISDGAPPPTEWRQYRTLAQIVGELAVFEPDSDEARKIKEEAPEQIRKLAKTFIAADPKQEPAAIMAAPDVLRAFARFKTDDLGEIARSAITNKDVQIRSTAAAILGDLPKSEENVEALKSAFWLALTNDKHDNDAQLSILAAVYKLEKKASVNMLRPLLDERDYLLRRRAFEMLADKDLQKDFPEIVGLLAAARAEGKDQVRPYLKFGTKLGQVLNTRADYVRALSRKNGSVKAVLTTEKGGFTIDFYPEEAPLTVDNFIKLARSGYFNGVEVHRVVPNFVMQDGDPRGDGNGGPGWSIRCEVNMLMYERGMVGMALSGKDTGGSQWFVTHSPQPHLDGGYTIFGRVSEKDMKVVDNIVRGDKIISVRIIGR